jgi:hypothetical protein
VSHLGQALKLGHLPVVRYERVLRPQELHCSQFVLTGCNV